MDIYVHWVEKPFTLGNTIERGACPYEYSFYIVATRAAEIAHAKFSRQEF
jgi:hypothetical protein